MPHRPQFLSDAEFLSALRDWFAGQALAGMQIGDERDFDAEGAAEYAYRCADAMIAARSLST